MRGFARRSGCPPAAVQRLVKRGAYPGRGPHGAAMRAAVAEVLAEPEPAASPVPDAAGGPRSPRTLRGDGALPGRPRDAGGGASPPGGRGWRCASSPRTAGTRSNRLAWFRRRRPWRRPERPVAGEPARGLPLLALASLYAALGGPWSLVAGVPSEPCYGFLAARPERPGAVAWRRPGRVTEASAARVVEGDGPGQPPRG